MGIRHGLRQISSHGIDDGVRFLRRRGIVQVDDRTTFLQMFRKKRKIRFRSLYHASTTSLSAARTRARPSVSGIMSSIVDMLASTSRIRACFSVNPLDIR